MKTQSYFLLVILVFISTLVHAGGDYWPVKVEEKITTDVPQKLKLEISEPARGIFQGCNQITVLLEYQRVPVWSWLPFIDSSHPTKDETTTAVEFLNNKFAMSAKTYFGYIGGGLFKAPSIGCTFKSKGLKLMKIDKENEFAVLSYYDAL
jgi:hypothetical protein